MTTTSRSGQFHRSTGIGLVASVDYWSLVGRERCAVTPGETDGTLVIDVVGIRELIRKE